MTLTSLESLLKAREESSILRLLWSYNTTPKTTTGESLFALTCGCEATFLVEVGDVP